MSLVSMPPPTVVKGKGPSLWASAAHQDHSGMTKFTSRMEEAGRLPVGSAGPYRRGFRVTVPPQLLALVSQVRVPNLQRAHSPMSCDQRRHLPVAMETL